VRSRARRRSRIAVLSWDLSHNCLGRAYLLAEVLAPEFDVEVYGMTFGQGVWRPADDGRFQYRSVAGAAWPVYALRRDALLKQIDADVLYAVKPRPSSFGIALRHRARTGTPVVLDIDDEESAFTPSPPGPPHPRWVRDVLNPNGGFWTARTVGRTHLADAITVASSGLRQRYGGALIRHVKDTEELRPMPDAVPAARAALGVEGGRVILFLGTPRPHKGMEDLIAAGTMLRNPAEIVVIGASDGDRYSEQLRGRAGVRVLGECSFAEAGFLLQAADVIVIPQRRDPRTEVQSPSKLFDAMAVGKPIVATAVGDIPDALADGRGLVVAPGDVPALAAAIDSVLGSPVLARDLGGRARRWCVENASYRSAAPILKALFDRLAAGRGS